MVSNSTSRIVKRIQTCWLKLHRINNGDLMNSLHHNRSYSYSIFKQHDSMPLCRLMAKEGQFLHQPDTKILVVGIRDNNLKILMSVLDSACKQIMKKYTPLYGIMLKYNISSHELARKLHVSDVDVCNNLTKTRLQFSTVKRIANAYHLSTYKLAKMYGYQSNDIRRLRKRQAHKRSNNIGHYLKGLRIAHNLTQIQAAKALNTGQSEITAIENWRDPGMEILIRCAALYKIPLNKLLRMCSNHNNIELRSICFRIAELRIKLGCTLEDISRRAHLRLGYVKGLATKRSHKDITNPWTLRDIIHAFNLSPDYFKGCYISTYLNTFNKYKKRTSLSEADFGYRYNKVRCNYWMSFKAVAKLMHITSTAAQEMINNRTATAHTLDKLNKIFPKEQNYLSGY